MAKKKVSKKVSAKRAVPMSASKEEKAAIAVVDSMSNQEFEEMEAGVAFKPEPSMEVKESGKDRNFDMVKISLPVTLKIKRKIYQPGTHVVPRHMAATMLEMVDRKRKADISMFTGKNYIVQRLLDRSLVIQETSGDINLTSLTK